MISETRVATTMLVIVTCNKILFTFPPELDIANSFFAINSLLRRIHAKVVVVIQVVLVHEIHSMNSSSSYFVLLLLFVSLFSLVFCFCCCCCFCYVSFIVSEVKLFVRHTVFSPQNCMSSSPISYGYSLLMST